MERNWAKWLKEQQYETTHLFLELSHIRDRVLTFASLKPTDYLLDIGTGLGRLSFKAYEKLKTKGKVVAIDKDSNCIAECQKYIQEQNIYNNFELYNMDLIDNSLPSESFDVVVSRSVIMHIKDKQRAFNEIYMLLKNNGRISLYEPILHTKLDRLYKFLNPQNITNYETFRMIENAVRNDIDDSLTNYDIHSLTTNLKDAGFSDIKIFSHTLYDYFKFTKEYIEEIDTYFLKDSLPQHISLKNKFLKYISETEFNNYLDEVKEDIPNKYLYQNAIEYYILALKNPSIIQKINFTITGIVYGIILNFIHIAKRISFYLKWYYLSQSNKKNKQ